MILAVTMATAGYVGMQLAHRGFSATPDLVGMALTPQDPVRTRTEPGAASATVNGVNVNLRTGPGLDYPVATRLLEGQPITVLNERAGWYSVTTNTGAGGWVFGAFVSGAASTDRGPAIVRRFIVANGAKGQVILRPGQRVLRIATSEGGSSALLPDGQQVAVEPGALADAR
jgi:N-acetylmuramoyl-L-alanine amidase